MPLSDMAARKAKPAERPYKLADSGGLFLLVQTGGSKLWRFKYRHDGKEKLLSFGPYPLITLAEARQKRDDAKRLLLAGTDPSLQKKRERAAAATAARNTFGLVAEEQLEVLGDKGPAEATMTKHRWLLTDLAGSLTDRPIAEITSAEVLNLLRRIERSGRRETAKKLRADISGVFRLAIVTAPRMIQLSRFVARCRRLSARVVLRSPTNASSAPSSRPSTPSPAGRRSRRR